MSDSPPVQTGLGATYIDPRLRPRWATPLLLPVVGTLLGVTVGACMNAVNAAVSTDYYVAVLGLDPRLEPVRFVIIMHGVVEGGILGLLFGVTFAVASAASTRLRMPFGTTLPTLLLAIAVTVTCALAGGGVGLAWAATDPAGFHRAVPFADGFDGNGLRRFAWVGGSINGAYLGTAVAALVGCVHLHLRWRTSLRRADVDRAFTDLPRPANVA